MINSVHIIYLAEDGISSLTCRVGTIAHSFLSAFEGIAGAFRKKKMKLRLSIISLEYKEGDIGFRPDFLKSSQDLCRRHDGRLLLLDKPTGHAYAYFSFTKWKKLNSKIRSLLRSVYDPNDAVTVVIANDTIFANSFLLMDGVINIWLPHSLSFLHRQSYVDQDQRLSWEMVAVERARKLSNCYIGSVSDFISGIICNRLKVNKEKVIPLHNGFYLPNLDVYPTGQNEVREYLFTRGIPLNRDIIFCFGRADEYKGLDRSFSAMLKIARRHDLLPVLIASRFSHEEFISVVQDKLKKIAAQSKIKSYLFLGYEFELPKYLMRYDRMKFLLNMPTRDFCPLAPYEAEILGHKDLCVVNSNIACFRSSIVDMKDGFIVQPAPVSIAEKIDLIMALPLPKKRKIIRAGKARAKRQMDLASSYQKSLEFVINRYL